MKLTMKLFERCPKSPTTKHVSLITKESDEICCKYCGKTLDPLPNTTPLSTSESDYSNEAR